MQNIKKKRIVISIIFGLMIVMIALGITSAVLTRNVENRANNFTFGNVTIELKEPEWEKLNPDDKIVYPNRTVKKDPIVENTSENDLYAYIEVKIPRGNVKTVSSGDDGSEIINDAKWQDLMTFNVNDGWTLIEDIKPSGEDKYHTCLYAYTEKVLSPGETTKALFDEVTYINMLEGEIEKGTVIDMPVAAYAIQSEYLNEIGSNIEEKMKDAFNKYKTQSSK